MAESFVDENIEIIDLKYNYSNFKVADFRIWQTFIFSISFKKITPMSTYILLFKKKALMVDGS